MPVRRTEPVIHKPVVVIDRNKEYGHDFYCSTSWRKLRRLHLDGSPLCVMCLKEGITTAADMVDHIVPIRRDPTRNMDPTNLQSLCNRHHSIKRASTDRLIRQR